MSKRPLQLIASLIAAVWLLCPVAFAEPESQPPPVCPDDAEEQLMGVIQGLQAGAYESLDPPYSIAAGARRDCQDNAVALGLAVDVLVQIAIIASNTGNAEGPRLWAEAHATVLEQDRATQRRDVKVTLPDMQTTTITAGLVDSGVDVHLEQRIAYALAALATDSDIAPLMQAELDTCPYTRDGQTRAWVEARGLNRGARGLAPSWQYGVILGRLGQLKQVCTEQSHALALEEIEAQARQVDWYVRMNQDAEATCEAEATLALITALREDIGSSSDRDDAALISKLDGREAAMKRQMVVACKR